MKLPLILLCMPAVCVVAFYKLHFRGSVVRALAATPKRNYFPIQRKGFYDHPSTNHSAEEDDDTNDDFQQWIDSISGKHDPVPTATIYLSKSNLLELVNQLSQNEVVDDDEEPRHPHQPYRRTSGTKTLKSENFEIVRNPLFNFTHIGGYDNIKEELKQCVDLLTHYTDYAKYNVRIPKGLILEGPPGNGKTMLAKGFAGECNTSFIAVSGSQFQDKYVGVGASRVRELFELAHKNIPCVIFIDEIDALGRKRSSEGETSQSERDNTLNELLVGLDGFKTSDGIFLIGATNRVDLLDPALLRPGRVDKHIYIGPPDAATREAILKIHLVGKPYNPATLDLKYLVENSAGFSGAQIENWLNEAMLNALRQKQTQIEVANLEEVMSRVLVGWQPVKLELTDCMIERIAIHEMGHAIVGMMSKYHARVSKVVINLSSPTSPGYTQFEQNAVSLHTKEALFEHLMILLAGRIAEEQFFEMSTSTGASDDLEKAFELAQKMISLYGMGKRTIYPRTSEKYKEIVDDEILAILNSAYHISAQWIKEAKPVIAKCADILIKDSIIKYDQILDIMTEMGEAALDYTG